MIQTDEQRAKSEAVKEKRKALLEARLAKVRQRKTIHAVPDLDLDVTSTEGIVPTFLTTRFYLQIYYISRESKTTRHVLWSRASVCLSVCLSAAACLQYCTNPDVSWAVVGDAP